ncbi:hypothetical protein PS862_01247 [Pseudomonas fluorescens]|uniref:Uncharacterized protein n=1 Tax=Pseudomonas fluorescens TaxID=294 RepID=A0A5E6Y6Y4_PSEFL|nr:hypothetical protein [Pseudomonas fluorescens]VVN48624.1 hypothetical protein PS639_06072 [Pseudomonas fluorescens]VVO69160.1 hypothetical protein PS862_01247 [Pseudomonas fluorescens]
MKVLNSRYTAQGHDIERRLILTQRTTASEHDTPILFQESCLGLANDQSQIVLRRYFESYSPDSAHWVEYAHSIPTASLIHWIMTQGQLHIEYSENTPQTHAHV